MKTFPSVLWLLAGLLCWSSGCSTTQPSATDEVDTIPRTGVGTFGGPGAFGGGQKPAMPTAPSPAS